MKYELVYDANLPELERLVNFKLSDGWWCQGGIGIGKNGYYQAMIIDNETWEKIQLKKP